MHIASQIGLTFAAIMALLSVFHAPYRRAAIVVTLAHLVNVLVLVGVWGTADLTGLNLYLFLAGLDLLVISGLVRLHYKLNQPILLRLCTIALCFVVVNLGTSWAMLNHEGNVFYYNYVMMIFTLNIFQGLLFGKSGIAGFKNGIYTMGNVLGRFRGIYHTNNSVGYYKNKT